MVAYRIGQPLRSVSGLLEAFAGRQQGSERPVVLKRLGPPWAGRPFVERFQALAPRLKGPALVDTVDVGLAGDAAWVAQELVESESLRHVLGALARAAGFVAPNEGLALLARVAAALEPLHAAGEAHGDVAASTIFLTPEGTVRLADAGLATAAGAHTSVGPARAEWTALAPEQLAMPAVPSTDVFRLGLVLYELSVGRALWQATSADQAAQLCATWQGLTRDELKHVPEPWLTLLLSMLSRDAQERPPIAEVAAVLEQGLKQSGWAASEAVLAALFTRACPTRLPFSAGVDAGEREVLELAAAPAPAATPPPPPGAPIARIATRKMSREELAAVRVEDTRPAAPAVALPPLRDARVGELLLERGLLTRQQLQTAMEQAHTRGTLLAAALESLGFIDEDTVVSVTAELSRSPAIASERLLALTPSAEALALVPYELARKLDAVPLGLKGGTQLVVAMREPLDTAAVDALKAAVGHKAVVAVRAGARALFATRERFYRGSAPPPATPSAPAPDFKLDEATQAPPWTTPTASLTSSSASGILRVELATRLLDTLLGLHGLHGTQARQLISLAANLTARAGGSTKDEARVRLAAQALVVTAFSQGRAPFELPRLLDFQDAVGFGTEVEPLVQALVDFPGRVPTAPDALALALAFSFAAHAGEPRPEGPALAAALASYRARCKLPPEALELLARELS